MNTEQKLRYYGEVTPSCEDNPTRKAMRDGADELTQLRTELAAERQDKHDALYRAHCRQEELHRKLASTQLQLKEAREALRKARTRIVEQGGSGWKCSVTKIDVILSAPADTTALDKLLAEKDAQIKELREALEYANQELRGMLEPECKNYYDSSIIGQALSRPADTTALNRYVAEELRDIREKCSVADNPLAVIDERANKLDPKRTVSS